MASNKNASVPIPQAPSLKGPASPLPVPPIPEGRIPNTVEGFKEIPPEAILFELPSKGHAYVNQNGEYTIPNGIVYIRPMTGIEQSIANQSGISETQRALRIVAACTSFPRTFTNVSDLLVQDALMLQMVIRTSTFGPKYKLVARCTNDMCRKDFEHEIDLNSIDMETMPRKKLDPQTHEEIGQYVYDPTTGIEVRLPKSDKTVFLRLLTMKDSEFLTIELKKPNSKFLSPAALNTDPGYFLQLALAIKSHNFSGDGVQVNVRHGNPMDMLMLVNKLMGMHAVDLRKIEQAYSRYDIGIQNVFETKCPVCGTTTYARFLLNSEFFRPIDDDE